MTVLCLFAQINSYLCVLVLRELTFFSDLIRRAECSIKIMFGLMDGM